MTCLQSETDFAGQSTAYARDQAGNAWQVTNRLNEITRTTFDPLNRPTRVDYLKDGTAETYAYDAAGNLASAVNGTVSYGFLYDTLNRLESKTDSRGRSLSFTWNKSGHIQTKTTYQGSTTHYTYDGAGTLVALSNPDYLAVNYQYDTAGRLLTRIMSSGAKSLYTYDAGGWLASLTHTDAVGAPVIAQCPLPPDRRRCPRHGQRRSLLLRPSRQPADRHPRRHQHRRRRQPAARPNT